MKQQLMIPNFQTFCELLGQHSVHVDPVGQAVPPASRYPILISGSQRGSTEDASGTYALAAARGAGWHPAAGWQPACRHVVRSRPIQFHIAHPSRTARIQVTAIHFAPAAQVAIRDRGIKGVSDPGWRFARRITERNLVILSKGE